MVESLMACSQMWQALQHMLFCRLSLTRGLPWSLLAHPLRWIPMFHLMRLCGRPPALLRQALQLMAGWVLKHTPSGCLVAMRMCLWMMLCKMLIMCDDICRFALPLVPCLDVKK